ncbi:MAG: hypothetical protein QXY40_08510 [Candidatus Methanomethylicia archaeon]
MLKTRDITLIAIFSVLYVILSALPGIPVVGISGARIELAASIAPLFGVILGPLVGSLAMFIAALAAWILPPGSPSIFGLLLIPCPVISALIGGLLASKKWIYAFTILTVTALSWYTTWIGIAAPYYPIMHFTGIALILILRDKISISPSSGVKHLIMLAIIGYCGLVADHMVGNIVFINSIGLFIPLESIEGWLKSLNLPNIPSLFMYMLPISATERIFMTIIFVLVSTPVLKALKIAKLK